MVVVAHRVSYEAGRFYVELLFYCAVFIFGQTFISFGIFGLDKDLKTSSVESLKMQNQSKQAQKFMQSKIFILIRQQKLTD